jgi:hypothetical protein
MTFLFDGGVENPKWMGGGEKGTFGEKRVVLETSQKLFHIKK